MRDWDKDERKGGDYVTSCTRYTTDREIDRSTRDSIVFLSFFYFSSFYSRWIWRRARWIGCRRTWWRLLWCGHARRLYAMVPGKRKYARLRISRALPPRNAATFGARVPWSWSVWPRIPVRSNRSAEYYVTSPAIVTAGDLRKILRNLPLAYRRIRSLARSPTTSFELAGARCRTNLDNDKCRVANSRHSHVTIRKWPFALPTLRSVE